LRSGRKGHSCVRAGAGEEAPADLLYFAYGSNLSAWRLRERVGAARALAPVRLARHRLVFNKRGDDGSAKANLVADAAAEAWGVLYALPAGAWPTLDRHEGGYARVAVEVEEAGGRRWRAQTYISELLCEDRPPWAWYRRLVAEGAREHGLPPGHVAALADHPARPDPALRGPGPTRIGVVSDTHNRLPNVARIVDLFNRAAVEAVVHTGDITEPRTLHALGALEAPLVGVYGNNDVEREALARVAGERGFRLAEPGLELTWWRRRIRVVHAPRDLEEGDLAGVDLALHGHDHRRRIERRGEALIVNPGECAGMLAGHNAVAVVDLAALDVEILRF